MVKASVDATLKHSFKRKRFGRFERYTPLHASRDVILRKACNLKLVHLSPLATSHPWGEFQDE